MTGGFDRLLTKNEFERFGDVLKSLAENSQDSGEAVRASQTRSHSEPLAVTQHQERVWLAQQQDAALTLRHASAWRLHGLPDIARLVRAIDAVPAALPELTMRFRFSDDGELLKYPQAGNDGILAIVNAGSREEAVSLILDRQQAPWDSERDAPFNVLVIYCPDEVILTFLMHRIIEEMCSPEDVLKALACAYGQEQPSTPSQRKAADFDPNQNEVAPVAWLRRNDSTSENRIAEYAESAAAHAETDRWARRYAALPETGRFGDLRHPQPDVPSLIANIGTCFAQFLCRLGGHEQVAALFPRRPEEQLGDQGKAFASPDTVVVPVSRDGTPGVAEVLAQMMAPADRMRASKDRSAREQLPSAAVRWLTDPQRFFTVPALTLERVPLPTAEPRPDFELAVGLDAEGRLLLELVTGQKIRRHAGSLVLDLFADFLNDNAFPKTSTDLHAHQVPSPTTVLAPEEDPSTGLHLDSAAIQAAILMEFREALATPTLKPDDDFFDFGGHSLVATRIIGRLLHNHGIEIRFNDLFGNPSAAALARHARIVHSDKRAVGNGSVEISTGNGDSAVAPLAMAQMSLWKIYSAFDYSEIFNLPFALDFLDPVDEAVFGEAFLDLMTRHAALRTLYFEDEQGEVLQKIVPAPDLGSYRWFWRSDESTDTDRNAEAGYRFDLSRELPVRLRFLRDKETGRQVLSFLFHHLALDEWSVNLMMDELVTAYRARALGSAPVWSGEPAPFHDFARRQTQAGVNGEHLAYWTGMLADAPRELVLFADDTTAVEHQEEDPAAGGWVEMRLKREISEGLYALAKENSASLFNVVYGAISAALQKLGGLSDLVIGTSASGRTDPDYFDTVGYFTTVVAHRVRFSDVPTIGSLVTGVKALINDSMPYTDIQIDLVEAALGMTPGRDHLFDVFIQIHAQNKLNGNLPAPDGSRIAFRQVDPDKHDSHLALQFEVMEEVIDGDRSIRVLMSYQAKRYTAAQIETIREAVMAMFRQFSEQGASEVKLSALEPA